MSIIETIGRAIAEDDPVVFGALTPDEMGSTVRAALRAIKPEDVSDGMVEAYRQALYAERASDRTMTAGAERRAIAAAIAAGADQ